MEDIAVHIPASFSEILSEIRFLKLISTKFEPTVAVNEIRVKPSNTLSIGNLNDNLLNFIYSFSVFPNIKTSTKNCIIGVIAIAISTPSIL